MGPSLRILPGARLMVVRVEGMRKPQLERAEKTRSWDSLTAVSGKPTRMKRSSPASPVLTST